MQPLISVIIATYNRASYLARTIESIRLQKNALAKNGVVGDIEIVIVDDGSTDNTKEVVASLGGSDIVYVLQPHNMGATAARNKGLESARGTWLMVWDSDDTLDESALANLLGIAHQFPQAGIISAPCRAFRTQSLVKEVFPHRHTGFISQRDILCRLLPANTKIRLVRREVFAGVRYQLKNLDFLVNVALAGKAEWYHYDVDLGTLYIEQDAVSLTANRKKPNPELSKQRARILDAFLMQYGEVMKKECPFYYAAYSYGAAVGLLLSTDAADNKKGRGYAYDALRYHPTLNYCALYLLSKIPGAQFVLQKLFATKAAVPNLRHF